MERQRQSFDICILCVLHEEASAVIDEFSTRCGITFTQAFRNSNQLKYFHSVIQNRCGESLSIFVTWFSEMGPIRTALDLKPLFQEINPRFVAMTGVCAGDRRAVKLGDLIVATSSYHLEEGKITSGTGGQSVHLPAPKIVEVTELVKQYVQGFNAWSEAVRGLRYQYLKRTKGANNEPVRHVGVMASSMAVHADNPFPALTSKYHRKTIGLDMETATFYTALRDFPLLHGLVVKGVSDYGDRHKTDRYRVYTSHASAVYMLHFIQEHVTEETMPRREAVSLPAFSVRAQRDLFFTGREELLQSLRQRLTPGSTTAITQAISGIGGIGKTHTAIEYAYRFRTSYEAVLWLPADSWENILSGCFTLATELGLPEAKEADRILAAVQHWLLQHSRWLLILDNVEQVQEILPRLLPSGYQGCVLLTTRAQHVEPFAQTQVMDLMPETEGVLFLLRRTTLLAPTADLAQATVVQYEEARRIWELLGGLPLALDQAGAYILETGCAFAAYCEQYKIRRTALLARRGWRFVGHEASVAATLSLAVQQVETRAPLAAEVLRICSLLDGGAIPEELFSVGAEAFALPLTPDLGLDEAFGVLQDYSLVQRNSEDNLLSVHRLVQAVLQDEMEEADGQKRMERMILAMSQIFPHVEPVTWMQCERMLVQALLVAQYIKTAQIINEQAGRLLHEIASYLRIRTRYAEAEPIFQRALRIGEQLFGPEHPQIAYPVNGLANLYRQQGKYEEAEQLLQRALHIREKQLGPEHSLVAFSLNSLAVLYHEQGKYDYAEPLYKQALHIREQLLGPEHPEVGHPLNNLAGLYKDQGRYGEAEPLYQRALRIWEKQLGPEHPEVGLSLNNLANFYRKQGKYEEAESLYKRALHIWEKQLGPEHHLVGNPLNNLAELHQERGKYTEAEPLYERALHIWEKQLGPEHHLVGHPLNGLATLFKEQGRYREAELFYQRALHIWELRLGPDHPLVATLFNNLASTYSEQGRDEETEQLYRRALAIFEQQLGSSHPDVVRPLIGLANLYRMQKRSTEAESLYQRASSICQEALVPLHPDTADTLFGFARLRAAQDNFLEAISLYRQALKIRRHVFGSRHPKTIEIRDSLRVVLQTLGRDETASQLEVEQLEQEDLERDV